MLAKNLAKSNQETEILQIHQELKLAQIAGLLRLNSENLPVSELTSSTNVLFHYDPYNKAQIENKKPDSKFPAKNYAGKMTKMSLKWSFLQEGDRVDYITHVVEEDQKIVEVKMHSFDIVEKTDEFMKISRTQQTKPVIST